MTALSRTADYFLEQALGQGNLGQHELAVTSLRQAIVLDKASVRAWRAMSEQLFAIGDNAGSEAASTQASILAVTDSSFRSVIARLQDPHLNDLEEVLLDVLEASPDDADALNGETLAQPVDHRNEAGQVAARSIGDGQAGDDQCES